MKISIAQTKSVKGDISANIGNHKKLINLSVSKDADLIIFPELSLTGYEPTLANALTIYPDDPGLSIFQKMANRHQITIGLGMPTKNRTGNCISLLIFQPHDSRLTYSKHFLHPDEEAYFVSGQKITELLGPNNNIALAICYEISIPEHSANAYQAGAEIYIASVAKTAPGVAKATQNLSAIAKKYAMTVMMSNCVGPCDGEEGGGKSSIWNKQGDLLGQLNSTAEGILMIDTDTQEIAMSQL